MKIWPPFGGTNSSREWFMTRKEQKRGSGVLVITSLMNWVLVTRICWLWENSMTCILRIVWMLSLNKMLKK
jgi:hypothetical protein